jgi:hypothetical protein
MTIDDWRRLVTTGDMVRPRTENQYRPPPTPGGTKPGPQEVPTRYLAEVPQQKYLLLSMEDRMAATRGLKFATRACSLWGVALRLLLL